MTLHAADESLPEVSLHLKGAVLHDSQNNVDIALLLYSTLFICLFVCLLLGIQHRMDILKKHEENSFEFVPTVVKDGRLLPSSYVHIRRHSLLAEYYQSIECRCEREYETCGRRREYERSDDAGSELKLFLLLRK